MKYRISSDEYSKLDEPLQNLYKKDGEGYKSTIEGVVEKSRLDEFRDTNIQLSKELKKFENVDIDKFNELSQKEQQIRDKKLIDEGDIETLFDERTKTLVSDFNAKLEAANSTATSATEKLNALTKKVKIDGDATKAFDSHKINPEIRDAALAQIRTTFVLDGDDVIAKDGDKILTGSNGNLTINEFVGNLPESFKIPSSGGHGKGGESHKGADNRTAADKIKDGLIALKN